MKYRTLVRGLAIFGAAFALVIPLAAPGRAADDVSESRSVSNFDKIRLQGAFTAEIDAGGRETKLVVSGDRDAVARVTAEVRDGTLVVGMRDKWDGSSRAPKLAIRLPALRSFANDGAGKITISGLSGGNIAIENSGAAKIVASGSAASETISLNGTGKVDATAVRARDVTVDNNGVGGVYVRGSGNLTLSVNGVGEIRYAGNPTHVQSSVNGIGRIGRM